MKSRPYIENLKKYPVLIEKIMTDFDRKALSGD